MTGPKAVLRLLVTPPTAKVRVNGTEIAAAERDAVFVEAGDVVIEVGGLAGYESKRRVVKAEKGKVETVEMGLDPLGGETAKPSLAVIGVGAGLAAVALGVGIGLGVAAKDVHNDVLAKRAEVERMSDAGPCLKSSSGLCKDIADATGRHDGFVGASIGLYVTAGVVAAATAAYAFWPRKSTVRAGAAIGPGQAALVVTGTF